MVSALLFVATCVLWVQSNSVKSYVSHEFRGINYGISARDGKVFIWKGVVYDPQGRQVSQPTRWSATGPEFEYVKFTPVAPNPFGGIRSAPQHYDFDSTGNLYLISVVAAPFWMIAIGLLLLPALVAFRFAYRRWKPKNGCCTTCGYDLRATPDRCPECGTIPVNGKQ